MKYDIFVNSRNYEFFKGHSIDATKLKTVLFQIIEECELNDIVLKGLVSDMSSDNQALWNQVGVYANATGENVLVSHPHKDGNYIVLMDDPTHAMKNFKHAMLKYKVKIILISLIAEL